MTAHMIRRWIMIGEYVETKLIQTRDTITRDTIVQMKDEGYVPLLDVNPVWATDYLGGERFRFHFTMQGVYVGTEKAWQSEGMVDGKLIPSSQKNK